ncbi:restriction endonuclease subunit S [Ralstonia sp. SET104]|uniref:restriction endonuclease subunit S n=1 Tax=Ralstonia sp. SET104 TaxID=2448774 RepID=UPI000F58F005|nr:restriction endonuclease subunit S [Ralstonia sp. SET104]GCB02612.1 type I restriction-modification protein subunit S [Ralstonia sp. SET104]
MKLKPYPKYKPSGVEWLGEVPVAWDITPLKGCFAIYGGSTPKSDETAYWDGNIVWVSPADLGKLPSLYISDSARKISQAGLESCATTLVPQGSIVLSTRAPIGSLAIAKTELCTNQGCKSLVPKTGINELFYAYSLLASTEALNLRGKGTTFLELSADELGTFKVPRPLIEEQSAIATFLDRETIKINTLIAKQEKLIELLKEKRQTVISHAVTKGLDSTVPMKPSGVEWLGDVPVHWNAKRIKWVAKMESGHTPDKKVPAYWESGDIPWVSLNDTGYLKNHEYISETAYQITKLGIENSSARLLPPEAVVFSRDATIGRCAITTRPMAVSQHFIAWLCSPDLLPEYLLYVFRSMSHELERLTFGATVKTIGMPDVKTLHTPVPPRDEQVRIVRSIAVRVQAIDTLIAKAQQAIELQKEHRSALISAAVTGKIDVRGLGDQDIIHEAVAA